MHGNPLDYLIDYLNLDLGSVKVTPSLQKHLFLRGFEVVVVLQVQTAVLLCDSFSSFSHTQDKIIHRNKGGGVCWAHTLRGPSPLWKGKRDGAAWSEAAVLTSLWLRK